MELPEARNSAQAVAQECLKARRGDAEAQYDLAWMFAHGRGVEQRNDWAAFLFQAAAARGHAQARQMLNAVSWPVAAEPDCLLAVPVPVLAAAAASPRASLAVAAPPYIEKLVRKLAPQYRVDPNLVLAIIAVESNFDVAALSSKNAMGLMQLIPQTSQRFGVRNAFDAQQNIRGGMAYLRWLLAYFEGDVALVAAAYNAGEGAVERHLGVPPYDETRTYVRRVLDRVGITAHRFDPHVTAPSAQLRLMRSPKG